MAFDFEQPVSSSPRGVAVWSDPGKQALFFVTRLNANTDGTPRSYRVDDFWGKRVALNNLCNAMSDACDGLSNQELGERRMLTERAKSEDWPVSLLALTKISSHIIPFRDGKPCPEINGYLVSATALRNSVHGDSCALSTYVDALLVPSLVLPRNPAGGQSEFALRNARLGDMVVAMATGSSKAVNAVVGDIGPANKLGEASLALNGELLNKQTPPLNYMEIRGRGPEGTRSWVVPEAAVLIFPKSKEARDVPLTPEWINEHVQPHFERWGGIERLAACTDAYSKRPFPD